MTAAATDPGRGVPLVVLAAGRATRYGGLKPLAPVGLRGEAVIDVLASDAVAAGFAAIVLVVGPDTGAAIRYHVQRTWPQEVDVRFATQETPRGTVDAVAAAAAQLDDARPFGVANADDLPGEGGLRCLAEYLSGEAPHHALVAYRLADSVIGTEPVTRGLCRVDRDGRLLGIDERRQVTPTGDGRFVAHDDREPAELDPAQPVSMNLWGFSPRIHAVFADVMARAGDGEVLLPEVVSDLLCAGGTGGGGGGGGGGGEGGGGGGGGGGGEGGGAGEGGASVRIDVLSAPGRCIGVTHASDVELVQAALAREVGRGDRPAELWTSVGAARAS